MVPFPIGSGLHFCFPFFATLCVVHWIDCAPFDGYSRGTIWISFDLQHGKMDKCTANIWPYNMIYISFEMKTRKKNSRNRMENNSGKKVGERTRAVHITNHQCGRWQANYCVILIPAPALCVHVRAHIVPFCVRTTFFSSSFLFSFNSSMALLSACAAFGLLFACVLNWCRWSLFPCIRAHEETNGE